MVVRGFGRPGSVRRCAVVAAAVAVATLTITEGTAAARVVKPVVTAFSASPSSIATPVGIVTLSGTVANALSCTLSASLPVEGLPVTSNCSSGSVTKMAVVPRNSGKKALKYKVTLTADGTGGRKSKKVKVVVAPGAGGVTVPGAPMSVTASAGNASAAVSFVAPASNGGAAITAYTVSATDTTNSVNGDESASGTSSPITVGSLTNGDNYTFTVAGTNLAGTGPASASSSPVTAATVPGAPSNLVVAGAASALSVTFASPSSDGGLPINSYTATATDLTNPANGGGTASGPTSPITVSGLTIGDSYTVTVTATNALGTGASSPASTPIVVQVAAGLTDLGLLPGGTYSVATGVNDNGQVVGYGDTIGTGSNNKTTTHAFISSTSGGFLEDIYNLITPGSDLR